MKRLIRRVRASFGATHDPSYAIGFSNGPIHTNKTRHEGFMQRYLPLRFIAPAKERFQSIGGVPGSLQANPPFGQSKMGPSVPTFGGIGGKGEPPAPKSGWNEAKVTYRRLDHTAERYYNVTPGQALGAGCRAIMVKLPR